MPESGLARKHASGLIDRLLPPFESSPTPTPPPLFVNSSGTDKEDKSEILKPRSTHRTSQRTIGHVLSRNAGRQHVNHERDGRAVIPEQLVAQFHSTFLIPGPSWRERERVRLLQPVGPLSCSPLK